MINDFLKINDEKAFINDVSIRLINEIFRIYF